MTAETRALMLELHDLSPVPAELAFFPGATAGVVVPYPLTSKRLRPLRERFHLTPSGSHTVVWRGGAS